MERLVARTVRRDATEVPVSATDAATANRADATDLTAAR
jgi:hypothetical protein